MKKVIKNNYKFILGMILGLVVSVSSVYAVEAYIESNKVSYDNSKSNGSYKEVQSSIDELYERSGIHKDKWTDKTLNGADPVLKDPLIPVEIKPNGEVYYANLNSEWYNYSEKRWANAVILTDTADEYSVGQHILEKDIESYFVWIPRYQYKIWNLANTEEYTKTIDLETIVNTAKKLYTLNDNKIIIDIKFGDVNSTPKMSESDAKLNEYYTHPAFTLGDKDLNGIWVGKFETGYKGANSKESAEVNEEEPTSVIIKPDVYSWRNINVKNAFMTSYNYERDFDSHMMKNTEWGAVAYLSHSQYGIGTEVNINNANDYKTGYSAAPGIDRNSVPNVNSSSTNSSITKLWNTETGYLASTTGNISGIYDMSGGAWEYVAAYMSSNVGQSGFDNDNDLRGKLKNYVDIYDSQSTIESYNKRILGDATGELGPFYNYIESNGKAYRHSSWYGDQSDIIHSANPWFARGSHRTGGSLAGTFCFHTLTGRASDGGFRIVLSI